MPDVDTGSADRRKPLRIFISSTSEDLREHRARVVQAIARLQQSSLRMETFGAQPSSPLKFCRHEAASADALVVIVAHRYGWVPSVDEGGDGRKSITWHELDSALAAGKPVFAFLVHPDHPWSGPEEQDRLRDARSDEEVQTVVAAVRGLADFERFLGSEVTWAHFTTPDDLASKVATSLLPWLVAELTADGGGNPVLASVEPDLRPYLEALIERCNHISVAGIAPSHARSAIRHPIERLYTPLSSRGELDPAGGLRHERVGLPELLPRHERLLIEGQPGAGKTTFLRLVATLLARDVLGIGCPEGGSWRQRHLGFGEDTPARVPVFVRISELVASMTGDDAPRLRHDNRHWLVDHLERSCRENAQQVPGEHWRKVLENGEAILLLDGLDEAADEGLRDRIFSIFRDAAKHWRCPMVVTSRPIATGALREAGFHLATIEPFGREEIATFVAHWVRALHTVEEGEHSGEAERYRRLLLSAIADRARVRRMAANPVMLTCLCVVHWNEGRLPEGRSRVYRAVLRWLIAARTAQRSAVGFSDLFAWRAFARLALAMMAGESGKRAVVDFEEAAVAVEPLLAREDPRLSAEERRLRARQWLGFECLGSGIVEELAGRRLRFWHLTFQEFLAALQLAWRGDGEDAEEDWWPLLRDRLDDAQWREAVELFPGCLLDEGGVGRVDKLLRRVLALRGEEPDLATEARVTGILGRLLLPLSVLHYKPSAEIESVYKEALERTLAIFRPAGAAEVPWKVRVEAAQALGRGGDPRLASGTDFFLEVPGLDGWRLGKYPVTVEEYQRFVEDRGYEAPRYWSDEGWAMREKKGWQEPEEWQAQLEHPSRPVTFVSWYEAEAYGRWLAAQRGIEVRLPTSEEWQRTAMPEVGEYPWGKGRPDAERANFDGNVGAPTPVGCYPAGDGRHGHSDLAGNVWEWCVDEIPEEEISEVERSWREREGLEGAFKVLRGGGWLNPAERLRAAERLWNPADERGAGIGFRLAASPPST